MKLILFHLILSLAVLPVQAVERFVNDDCSVLLKRRDSVDEGYQQFETASRSIQIRLRDLNAAEEAALLSVFSLNFREYDTKAILGMVERLKQSGLNDLEQSRVLSFVWGHEYLRLIKSLKQAVEASDIKAEQEMIVKISEQSLLRLGYLFWPDHGTQHVRDVQRASSDLFRILPESLTKRYRFLFENTKWKNRLMVAIQLHDSQMFDSRSDHAELVLLRAKSLLQGRFSQSESNLIGFISFMHSKSAVPYGVFPDLRSFLLNPERWSPRQREVFNNKSILKVFRRVASLDDQEYQRLLRAIEWIRMSDAYRPIGVGNETKTGLRNSLGQRFLFCKGRTPCVELQDNDGTTRLLEVLSCERGYILGQLALENPSFRVDGDGRFIISFPTHPEFKSELEFLNAHVSQALYEDLSQPEQIKKDLKVLSKVDSTSYAILKAAMDILFDFNPDFTKKVKIEFYKK